MHREAATVAKMTKKNRERLHLKNECCTDFKGKKRNSKLFGFDRKECKLKIFYGYSKIRRAKIGSYKFVL